MSALATEPARPIAVPEIPSFLELEVTQFCQLKCAHCYSNSGPEADRGTMTLAGWRQVLDQAAALGVETVQFIGGEPTLDPNLLRLARHALAAGLNVNVYSNLVRVTPVLWELFTESGVSVSTSWYTADTAEHAVITGSRIAYASTKANIAEAIRRGISVHAAIVTVLADQDTEQAAAELSGLGVTDIRIRPAQGVGRAARDGHGEDVSELCGHCGLNRAAILPDGKLTPCVIGRWLNCGNVRDTPLADILASPEWQRNLRLVPRVNSRGVGCPPASDGEDCAPAQPQCSPQVNYAPPARSQ